MHKTSATFSWKDSRDYIFMDVESFEEIRVHEDDVDCKEFLAEGQEIRLTWFNNAVIAVELPIVCTFKVVGIDQSSNIRNAVLDCGATVVVPAFVEVGTSIRVNTADAEYVDRA